MIQTTQEELELLCARFFPVFQEYLRRRSIATGNIELAVSLDGVYSLPALYDLGGVQKTVRVPLALLTRDVDMVITNCTAATTAANTAAANATSAAKKVTDAITDISREKQAALDAAASANTAKANADAVRVRIEGKEVEWSNAESSRATAETRRVTAENIRVSEETKRAAAENSRVVNESARQSAEDVRRTAEAKRQSDTSKAISDCNTATANANKAKNECQDVATRCDSTNSTAEEKIVAMDAMMKNFSGEANAAPVVLQVSAPAFISMKNKVAQKIGSKLLPGYVMQNVLYQKVRGDSLMADPSGNLIVLGIGRTVFYIIPPQNTGLWKQVDITVRNPLLRLGSTGKIRLNGSKLRIV